MSDINTVISLMIENALSNSDMLVSTQKLLKNIKSLLPAAGREKPVATISCAAECVNPTETNNPPRFRIAVKISNIDGSHTIYDKVLKKSDNHRIATLQAIYHGLTSAFGLKNKYNGIVEVRTQNRDIAILLTDGLDEDTPSNIEDKIHGILDFCDELPCPISFVWRPEFFDADMKEVTARAKGK